MTNELYYGDNLDILRRKIASESVDLCYIDPPFNSKRNYFQIYNNQGGEAETGLAWITDVEMPPVRSNPTGQAASST